MATKKQNTPNVPVDEQAPEEESVAVVLAEQELEQVMPPQTPTAAPAPTLTITQQRAILAAHGMKVCNRHIRYFDRLPDAAKVAVGGYPVEVRLLTEFAKGAACCRPCYKLYDQEWRDAHRTPGTPTTRARQEAILAKKIAQRNQLTAEIERLQASLAALPGEGTEV